MVIVLTACGPAGPGNSGEPSSAASLAASEAVVWSSAAASASQGAGAELDGWIPDTVAGVMMNKQTVRGSLDLLFGDEAAAAFLEDLGVSLNDVSLAIGIGYQADVNVSARMFVLQVAGADRDPLEAAFKDATDAAGGSPKVWTEATIGGKRVETAVDGLAKDYLYVTGDVLVFLVPSDPDVAAEIMSGLP